MTASVEANHSNRALDQIVRILKQRIVVPLAIETKYDDHRWSCWNGWVPSYPADTMEWTIPVLAKECDGGLSGVAVDTLKDCLQPVLDSLRDIDAGSLLNLEQISSGGARLCDGVNVRPIHEDISPPCDASSVRYIHLSEIPGQYSMGVFVFPPHAKIPLHDHPGMCVLSRVLYGDLHRISLDVVRDESSSSATKATPCSWTRTRWSSTIKEQRWKCRSLPDGSKRACNYREDYLSAPDCTMLYPFEGNLHEFVAGPNGAAVLDILLPPYDGDNHRDCTFYHIHDPSDGDATKDTHEKSDYCWIVPTGLPEDFHCISGTYSNIGFSR